MSIRDKDVMIYHYEPKKKVYLVSLHLENRPGALGNLGDLMALRGMNILEGHFGGMSYEPKATLSFFVETTNQMMDAEWLKDYIESSVFASDVVVKSAVDGYVVDSVDFPLTWNTGDRAVLMRIPGIKVMLSTMMAANPQNASAMVYDAGFNYGKAAWEDLMGTYHPKTKESLANMLTVYNATGWGRTELTHVDPPRASARIKMYDGFECVSPAVGDGSNFIRGHLAGALSVYFGRDVKGSEKKCMSKGEDHCEFEFAP